MKAVDMIGQRFGRLTVFARAENSTGSGQARWVCACDCGGQTVTHGSNLRRGRTLSCGCAVGDANRQRLATHGMSKTDTYQIWLGMRRRCLVPSHQAYPRYGGRGIGIAPAWDDFTRFLADVGERPSAIHSLDRIDNDGNYEPGNVRWATPEEQAANRGPVARLRRENAALLAKVDELTAKIERRRLRLVEAEADLLNVRGILSPNGYPRRVPVDLVPTVAPAVQWLADRVDELTVAVAKSREQAATYANEIGRLAAENARVRQQRDAHADVVERAKALTAVAAGSNVERHCQYVNLVAAVDALPKTEAVAR